MFEFPAEITIAQVDNCKSELLDFITEHEEIDFDDSQVTRVDTVGVQLILATIHYIAAQNKSLIWQCKSPILNQSIKQLGINDPILNQYFNV
jgi:anti-anti-sigma regulatory factor